MDPVTAAIVAAVTSGVVSGAAEVSKQGVVDAYKALKSLIGRKYGSAGKVMKAVRDFEGEPTFEPYIVVLERRVAEEGVDKDQTVVQAAEVLLKRLEEVQSGPRIVRIRQTVRGDQNAVVGAFGKAVVIAERSGGSEDD